MSEVGDMVHDLVHLEAILEEKNRLHAMACGATQGAGSDAEEDLSDDPFSEIEEYEEENYWFNADKLLEVEKRAAYD